MKNKQGISLIVLVITIIVMIILAASIILSLNNAGIIGNANKAVEMTNDKTTQTAADLKYSEYILKNDIIGSSTVGEWIKSELIKEGVIPEGEEENYLISDKGEVINLKLQYSTISNAAKKVYNELVSSGTVSNMLSQGEYIKQKLIEQGTITVAQAEMYRFKNNGEVVKLQTKEEYESMYAQELGVLDSSYYTITSNKEFSLTTAGKNAATTGNLTKLAIPYGVTKIHYATATNCTKLTELIMPDTLENIDFRAFANCENIETIRFSKNLKSVREEVFKGTKWLVAKKTQADTKGELVIEEGVLILGDIGKSTVVIPNNVDVVGGMAFNYNWPEENTTLKNVTVPNTVENIEVNAFGECTKIDSFTFLGQLPAIGWGAFGCWNGPAPAFANDLELYNKILEKNAAAFLGGD